MEILNMRINWMLGYLNHPTIEILVDKIPDDLQFEKKPRLKGALYFAEKDGYVRFYAHNPSDESGFGGSLFVLPMKDGSVEKIRGPWSSRCSYMNQIGFIHSREVAITDNPDDFENRGTFYAGYVTIEKLQEGISKFMPELELVIEEEHSEISYEPVPKSALLKERDEQKAIGEELYPYRPPVHISEPMRKVKDFFSEMIEGMTITEAHKQNICVSCKKDVSKIIFEYDPDGLGYKEYRISGLCPRCFPKEK